MGFFKTREEEAPFVSAVIVAAGNSSRMDGVDKLSVMLDGIPVVARSIGSFCECPGIAEIVVVCREEQIANFYDLVRFYHLDKVTSVVAGGESRQDSVFAGVGSCREDAGFYAIHDGARPLVLPEDITRCMDAAFKTGAAAVGAPVKDTIKIVDENGVISSTPNRKKLWAVHTPQIFGAKLYKRAMAQAIHENRSYTDDCQLVERVGHPVTMVCGSYGNIKITTLEDVAAANAILGFRQGGGELWQL